MKKCLEMFDEHLDEVVAAFRGDDDTLQPFLLYDEDYNFEVDLSRILMGDLDQLDSPKGPRRGGSSFIFFVVQNKAGSGHRCWPLDAATSEIASDGSAILFSTKEGKLEVFKSTKNVLHIYTHTRTTCTCARMQARLKRWHGSECAGSPTSRKEAPSFSLSASIWRGITLRDHQHNYPSRETTDKHRTTTTNSSSSHHHDSAPPRLQSLICNDA